MATRVFYLTGSGRSLGDKLRLAAALVIGAGILFAALVVSLSIALVLIPIGAIAYLFRRQIMRALLRSMSRTSPGTAESVFVWQKPAADERIIDGEYRVVPPRDRNR